jgi:GH25 family lysozyme M1 (1,4-beta-N-acetylmuramidase)
MMMTQEPLNFTRGVDSRPFSSELKAHLPVILVPEFKALAAPEWEVRGVDVSYWQGDIDFIKMAENAQFVVLRYGYGNTTVDARLKEYYPAAVDAGLAVMGYWYNKPAKNWEPHAETFSETLDKYPALWAWGDCEETGGLDKVRLDGFLFKLFRRLSENLGGSIDNPKAGIYTSPGFWNLNMPRTDWAKRHKLWGAHWTSAFVPILPNDWAVPNKPWNLWQFSSKGGGKLYGVSSTYIDLNRYNGTVEQFNSEYGASILPIEPPEPPPPPPPPDNGDNYMKVQSAVNYLRVRQGPGISYSIKDYMMLGDETEALEEFADGRNLWIRIGFKQWSAMLYNGNTYLIYVE